MSSVGQVRPGLKLWEQTHGSADLGRKAALILGASLLVSLAAHVTVPLPFTPVPLTLQTLAVMLVGMALGPTMAFATLILYLVEGAGGMPVFSPAGPGGLAQLLGPTGGFLFSYPLAAAIAGLLSRPNAAARLSWTRAAFAGALATVIILVMGGLWFAAVLHSPLPVVLRHAVLPFLPGEAVKIAAAASIATALRRRRS